MRFTFLFSVTISALNTRAQPGAESSPELAGSLLEAGGPNAAAACCCTDPAKETVDITGSQEWIEQPAGTGGWVEQPDGELKWEEAAVRVDDAGVPEAGVPEAAGQGVPTGDLPQVGMVRVASRIPQGERETLWRGPRWDYPDGSSCKFAPAEPELDDMSALIFPGEEKAQESPDKCKRVVDDAGAYSVESSLDKCSVWAFSLGELPGQMSQRPKDREKVVYKALKATGISKNRHRLADMNFKGTVHNGKFTISDVKYIGKWQDIKAKERQDVVATLVMPTVWRVADGKRTSDDALEAIVGVPKGSDLMGVSLKGTVDDLAKFGTEGTADRTFTITAYRHGDGAWVDVPPKDVAAGLVVPAVWRVPAGKEEPRAIKVLKQEYTDDPKRLKGLDDKLVRGSAQLKQMMQGYDPADHDMLQDLQATVTQLQAVKDQLERDAGVAALEDMLPTGSDLTAISLKGTVRAGKFTATAYKARGEWIDVEKMTGIRRWGGTRSAEVDANLVMPGVDADDKEEYFKGAMELHRPNL